MSVKKEVRDGKVAVLYSPGHGAGWSTWCSDLDDRQKLMFDPSVVYMVEQMHDVEHDDEHWQVHIDNWLDNISEYMNKEYPHFYHGGVEDLQIAWLPEGTKFRINEYDGDESIELKEEAPWETA